MLIGDPLLLGREIWPFYFVGNKVEWAPELLDGYL
jgi:hypothetical protein